MKRVPLAIALALALLPAHAQAQSSARRDGAAAAAATTVAAPAGYPARPLRLAAGTSPGGSSTKKWPRD